MWYCVESLLEFEINSVKTVSLVNLPGPMFDDKKKLGDTRSVASKTVLVI